MNSMDIINYGCIFAIFLYLFLGIYLLYKRFTLGYIGKKFLAISLNTTTIFSLLIFAIKYFLITQMPIISGRYWNMVHGNTPEEVVQDLEGMQNLRVLARNMAWHLKCNELALKSGLTPPQKEEVVRTNFIR